MKSITQYAKENKISRQAVLKRIKRGKLLAEKVGNYWVIIGEKNIRPTRKNKPKAWSRKGRCPGCGVGTGSKHRKDCKFEY